MEIKLEDPVLGLIKFPDEFEEFEDCFPFFDILIEISDTVCLIPFSSSDWVCPLDLSPFTEISFVRSRDAGHE